MNKLVKTLLLGVGTVGILSAAVAIPAQADDHRHWDRGHGRGHHYGWHRPPPRYIEPRPAYAYAPPPPPVAYYPQPVEPVSTGINLVLPLHFH